MVERGPTEAKNIDEYGNPPIDWSVVRDVLAATHGPEERVLLATVRPDGSPHPVGIGVTWFEGDFYFTSRPQMTKSANLASNPCCTIAGRMGSFDVSLDGVAERIVDPATMHALVERFEADEWPATVVGDMIEAPFNAQTASLVSLSLSVYEGGGAGQRRPGQRIALALLPLNSATVPSPGAGARTAW